MSFQFSLYILTYIHHPTVKTIYGMGKIQNKRRVLWCVNGYCEEVGSRRYERVPVVLNPQDGGWSDWSPWGACSRTCGMGAQFKSRECNNPEPSYGGKYCVGNREEWRLCNQNPCPEPLVDLRAQQCQHLPRILHLEGKPEANFTWLPYESDQPNKKCKYICVNAENKELYVTGENLMDGTPCSYEDADNICVQGKCQVVGCDGNLKSQVKRDRCGTCAGNNSECAQIKFSFDRKLRREVSRVSVLPRMAREIKVEINVMRRPDKPSVAFILKNRRKRKYTVTIPNTVVHTKIIEGTKFSYKKVYNKHTIWAKGPLFAEMVILGNGLGLHKQSRRRHNPIPSIAHTANLTYNSLSNYNILQLLEPRCMDLQNHKSRQFPASNI
ncbi:hypothetical protein NQ318_018044 [Aromia moschata]|uniref:ADAMTS/ADAMTS-like cysteine-rich domain-containing protein n=1 Tax=Aromia moschata TaxID=1265417 RepID=A0AAV8ZCE2_9CUCU|nr:hypothetical protein NQ318_018044 [Aromia moschata]